MASGWIVILEKGASHTVPENIGIETIEEAIEFVLAQSERMTGLKREKMIRVIGVINYSRIEDIRYALGNCGFKLS